MRGLKWLVKLAVSAAVTSVCCVAVTFFTVNTYVDAVLEQLQIERPASARIEWAPFVSRLVGSLGIDSSVVVEADRVREQEMAVSATPVGGSTKDEPSGSSSKRTNGDPDPYRVPEDAVAVWNSQSLKELESASEGTELLLQEDRKVVVSSEEFTKKKEQLSDSQKAKVFSMLATRLPQKDLNDISVMMENGLTASEVKRLDQLLQQHLKPEEYTELKTLIETP
ncbi:hypothetical protein [Paenibacillus sp. YYML68]|uniref:hypothetical protein n=1 Tax=Paenibacillus sp. YYML68 TaxID=2909250 RepID=UPI002491E209|nr:hypothetical protein [Paenibacillus sp. YYML68]